MSYTPPPNHSNDIAAWKKWIAGFWRHTEEKGTWTPSYGGSTGDPTSVTYEFQNGLWVRRGSVMHVWGQLGTTSLIVGSGDLQVKGLPRSSNVEFNAFGIAYPTNFVGVNGTYNSNKPNVAYVGDGNDWILFTRDDGTAAQADANYLGTGASSNRLRIYISYTVDI